jgi:thiol:disulfide interchange protein
MNWRWGILAWAALAQAADPPNPYSAPAPGVWTPAPVQADPFDWDIPVAAVVAGEPSRLRLRLVVPPEYHVYRDQLEVKVLAAGGLEFGEADFPKGSYKVDPAVAGAGSTEARELYEQDVIVYLPVQAPKRGASSAVVELELRHQGCKAGLCYPPVTQRRSVLVPVRPAP